MQWKLALWQSSTFVFLDSPRATRLPDAGGGGLFFFKSRLFPLGVVDSGVTEMRACLSEQFKVSNELCLAEVAVS